MVDMPSPIASSAAQSAYQSREVAKLRDAGAAAEAGAAGRQTAAVDEAGRTVDTADADDRVFTDAEGQGSQGRSAEQPDAQPESSSEAQPASPHGGITTDPDGRLHVDVEA